MKLESSGIEEILGLKHGEGALGQDPMSGGHGQRWLPDEWGAVRQYVQV